MDISAIPWILVVIVAAVLGTLSGFIDNFVTDVIFDGKYGQAEKMLYGPLYIIMGIIILATFQPASDSILPILILFAAGIVSSIGSIPYFAGLEREETTSAKIFAQLIPIFSLVLAWIFLHQEISPKQLIAFGIILLAPIIIILSKRKRSKKTELKSGLLFTLNALIVALSSLLFVGGSAMVPSDINFLVCLAIMLCGKGSTDLIIMACKKNWRRHFFKRLRATKWRMFAIIGGSFLVWQSADLLYRFSTVSSDSVALVAVTYEAIELIATFFFGIVLSLLWPSFGREKLDKRTVLAHLVATAVALVGILLVR